MPEGISIFFWCTDISQQHAHRCHRNTYEMPSYLRSLDGSIRVNCSLLHVRTALEGGQLFQLRRPRTFRTCVAFHVCTYSLTVRTHALPALASFLAHQCRQSTCVGLCQGRLHIEIQEFIMAASLCILQEGVFSSSSGAPIFHSNMHTDVTATHMRCRHISVH